MGSSQKGRGERGLILARMFPRALSVRAIIRAASWEARRGNDDTARRRDPARADRRRSRRDHRRDHRAPCRHAPSHTGEYTTTKRLVARRTTGEPGPTARAYARCPAHLGQGRSWVGSRESGVESRHATFALKSSAVASPILTTADALLTSHDPYYGPRTTDHGLLSTDCRLPTSLTTHDPRPTTH